MRRMLLVALCVCACAASACTSDATPAPRPTTKPHPVSTTHSHRTPSASVPTVSPTSTPTESSASPDSSAVSPPQRPPGSPAERAFAAMSEAERVGQLLMVDCPSSGVASATVTAIRQYHVGSVILDGNSTVGVTGTHTITSQLQHDAPSHRKLFISTDQEGGLVQRMRGSGFSSIPSAVSQGHDAPAILRSDAKTWAGQLRAAGINVDLAPVLDTVPNNGQPNPPIGDLDREYGHTPSRVRAHGVAFARGLAAAGVDATVKHFPGLGRVTGNTDTTSGVTDSVTTRNDPYLAPFAAAVRADVPFVMMSTAIYSRIDAGTPAAFSHTIVNGMLRGDLGFRGLIISDDVGGAQQVSGYPVGERAVRFIAAGGDIVLTVVASQAATMTAALLARARRSPSFKKKVDAAALLVLQEKQARGLVT
jgi:beta-N-acetylhexosaminidase